MNVGSQPREQRYRKETVYDAVAGTFLNALPHHVPTNYSRGRIAPSGFIPKHPIIPSTRDTISSTTIAAAPEAVLFRRKNAPTRYAESDIYFAKAQNLRTELPESDLLKALHCYTSDYYARAIATPEGGDWRSMDETALIAMGILMEELARETLGQTGDLVFTEGEELDASSRSLRGSRAASMLSLSEVKPHKGRASKRRRIIEGPSLG
jgi:hypothetical protein